MNDTIGDFYMFLFLLMNFFNGIKMQNINTAALVKNINGLWNNIDSINMNVNNSINNKLTQLETQITDIKNIIYPINIVIYVWTNGDEDINPSNSSILGFGTWEKIDEMSTGGVFAYRRTA